MVLFIDTSTRQKIFFRLTTKDKVFEKLIESEIANSQQILPEMEIFLNEHGFSYTDLTALKVHTGPGSFTGIRVGIITAQTLSLLLHIPLNDLPPGSLPPIDYGKDIWNLDSNDR